MNAIPRKYVCLASFPSRSSGKSRSSFVSKFKTLSDCFSAEAYAPYPLCSSTAKRPSGEIAAAVGKLFVGRGLPGTSPRIFPLDKFVVLGAPETCPCVSDALNAPQQITNANPKTLHVLRIPAL
jgi:hypothetical protein